jgi:RHS repeat-associated protein
MKLKIMRRFVCLKMAVLVTLLSTAGNIFAKGENTEKPASPGIHFSARPSELEIFNARVFDEPLVPMGGPPDAGENKALAEALVRYATRTNVDDFSSLADFLTAFPDSKWQASLWLHLGKEYYNTGYYSKSLAAWETAWTISQSAGDPKSEAQADRALGELARMYSKLGRLTDLQKLLDATKDRPLHGAATQLIASARDALWQMRNNPECSFRCGPLALDRILSHSNPAKGANPLVVRSKSTTNGFSLDQVAALSAQLGLNYQMAFRSPDAPFVVPAVVHWKVGHYAALLQQEGDRFLVQDYTFQDSVWVTRNALAEESSGYFLVPGGSLPSGWRSVAREEGQTVWGKGIVGGPDPNGPSPGDPSGPGGPPPCGGGGDAGGSGMATYKMTLLYVSLNITDTPEGYKPPVGPAVRFTAAYNQAESHQPATFYYSNLGQKWTCNWITYIMDNPTSPDADVSLYVDGGGTYPFSSFNPATQSYLVETLSHTLLVKTSSSSYELQYPDGSRKEFALSDGSTGTSRRVFLTQVIDQAGNTVQLNYDSSLRITNIIDAIGQATILSYTNTALPYSITSVEDPFGRTAYLQYNSNGMLAQITDVIGYTSHFNYSSNEFIAALTTPYGTTTFSNGPIQGGSYGAFLQATDPLGQTERLEFNQTYPIASSDPPPVLPQGLAEYNIYLWTRDSFFWDKNAYAQGHGDYTKAKIYHWCHAPDIVTAARVLECVKAPLESRIWYNYPGQTLSYLIGPGMLNEPTVVARVMDDGTTQISYNQYNFFGALTNSVDPVGRTITYVYDTNGIDLLQVRQTRGADNELLSTMTYDAQHRPLTVTDAAGQTRTNVYNARGQILSISDALGETTTFSYDTNGYLLTITGPLQNATDIASCTYDSVGRLRTSTDTEGYALTYDYDALDRPTQITYPDGTTKQYVYKLLDLGAVSDRLGRWTTNTYDPLRRLVQTQDPLGRITYYQWCSCGAVSSLTDPMGRVTTWRYDLENRPIAKQYADGSMITQVYENSTSRPLCKYDEEGQQTLYSYYPDNNVRSISFPNAIIPTPTVTFTYDPNYNRILTMQDGVGMTTFSYNPVVGPPALGAGRLASVVGPLANSVVTYQYDQLSRQISRAINGVALATSYDILGRPARQTNALGSFQFSYFDTTRHLASEVYPDGQTNLYVYYDNAGDQRLRQITHLNPDGSLLSSFGYAYNAVGQIVHWTNIQNDLQETVWNPIYDAGRQLTNAVLGNGAAAQLSYSYSYDGDGNRLTAQAGSNVLSFSYDALNQLTASPPMSTNASYEWDAKHQLAAVNKGVQRTEYTYDGMGRRVGILSLSNSVVITNRLFVFCGADICEERNSTGEVVKRFYRQGVQDETQAPNDVFFYTHDHLGSIRELTGNTGAALSIFSYDPFGQRSQLAGSAQADFAFAGQFYDNTTSLSMTLFRVYDTFTGRWLSRDPFWRAEVTHGPGLYAYVNNDPINMIDPLGLQPVGPKAGTPGTYPPANPGPGAPGQCLEKTVATILDAAACAACIVGNAASLVSILEGGDINAALGYGSAGSCGSVCNQSENCPAPDPPASPPNNCEGGGGWDTGDAPSPCNPTPMCEPPSPDPDPAPVCGSN